MKAGVNRRVDRCTRSDDAGAEDEGIRPAPTKENKHNRVRIGQEGLWTSPHTVNLRMTLSDLNRQRQHNVALT